MRITWGLKLNIGQGTSSMFFTIVSPKVGIGTWQQIQQAKQYSFVLRRAN